MRHPDPKCAAIESYMVRAAYGLQETWTMTHCAARNEEPASTGPFWCSFSGIILEIERISGNLEAGAVVISMG
jgi:hypothetical protein